MGWLSNRRAARDAPKAEKEAEKAAEERRQQIRLEDEQKRIEQHSMPGETVLDFLSGTYLGAQHYIAAVTETAQGVFNHWDSRYVADGEGNLVLTNKRILFVPNKGDSVRAGEFKKGPRDRSVPADSSPEWTTTNGLDVPKVPQKYCLMVSFDGRYLPKYDEFGYLATNTERVQQFHEAVARAARTAR
jgi:hypothetical protein